MKRAASKASLADAARVPRLPNGAPDVRLLLTWQHVRACLDMGKNTAIKARKLDARFPRPVAVPGTHPRWIVSELEAYVALLVAERDRATA